MLRRLTSTGKTRDQADFVTVILRAELASFLVSNGNGPLPSWQALRLTMHEGFSEPVGSCLTKPLELQNCSVDSSNPLSPLTLVVHVPSPRGSGTGEGFRHLEHPLAMRALVSRAFC